MSSDLTGITVVGDDDTGLIARITSLPFERGCNVEDLDQAVQDGVFRMTLHADTAEMVCRPATLREDLRELGDELGVDVRVRFPSEREIQDIAVLVPRESHPLRALLAAAIDAEMAGVIGNRNDLADVAREHDVAFHDIGDDSGVVDESRMLDLLDEYDTDPVVHRGRTEVRDAEAYQPGLPESFTASQPDAPVDGRRAEPQTGD